MSRSFKLTVAYDGADYVGWQVQPNGPSIQAVLEQALKSVTKQAVSIIGSGRTDAGVHALGQVASCTIDSWNATADELRKALNTQLPDAIVVHQVVDAPNGFHAIRDAYGKRYRYQLQIGGAHDPFEHRYRWRLNRSIDVDLMRTAASLIVGEHDFVSFQAAGAPRPTTVRHVTACELIEQPDPLGQDQRISAQRQLLAIEVEANGFLYNMVRNIVGSLVEVGRGKHAPSWISDVIAARNRDVAGPTAPPQGLFLLRVDYAAPNGKAPILRRV